MIVRSIREREGMKIASIDLETTGLDWEFCQVIEFGAVIEEAGMGTPVPVEDLPTFHAYLVRERYQGEPYALAMHAAIFRRIAQREPGFLYIGEEELGPLFRDFLIKHGYARDKDDGRVAVTCTGKNYGMFDDRFLGKIPSWKRALRAKHRVLDVGSRYFDPYTDADIPDTAECLRRAGVDPTVRHEAVGDARNVIRMLRHSWQK
jgi:hypothetical protein